MHRSYNSYNPVASKLLQKRWDEKHFSDHRKAVNHIRPEIDSTPPVTFMHLHLKLKKLQLEEERLATIERDNRILLEKMSHTMRNKGQLDNINSAVPKSLSKGRRERELLRITRENMNMLKRIANKKPAISRDSHERDWQENLHFMSNISSFPEDWYLKNKRYNRTSQSNPNLQSNRSEESEVVERPRQILSSKLPAQSQSPRYEKKATPVKTTPSPKPEPPRKEPTPVIEERRKSTPKKVVVEDRRKSTPKTQEAETEEEIDDVYEASNTKEAEEIDDEKDITETEVEDEDKTETKKSEYDEDFTS